MMGQSFALLVPTVAAAESAIGKEAREKAGTQRKQPLEERQEAQASQDQAAIGQIGSLQLLKAKPLPQTTGSKGLIYVEAPMKKDLFDIELLQWPRS
ncbi:hypothetical protein Ancab_039180, partial [Ancistrocladus abbreviatus]